MSKGFREKLGLHRRDWVGWALYDWGQSAFTTTIMVGMLPPFFSKVAAVGLEGNMRTAMWSYISALGLIITAFISPAMGVYVDRRASNKSSLFWCVVVGCLATAALALVGEGQWVLTGAIFLVAFIAFALSLIMCDSLLMQIATPEEADTLSSAGYAIGYLGGGILFVVNVLMVSKPDWFGLENTLQAMKWSFISVAVWWFVFSLPLFYWVPERPLPPGTIKPKLTFKLVADLYREIFHTFKEIRAYRDLFIFLCAYWLYSDGIGTIFRMSTVYGDEVGIKLETMMAALIAVQFIGVPSTYGFAFLARKIGAKNCMYITLVVYCFVTIFGYFMTTEFHFWALSILVGLVQGGSQALSRSLYTRLVPPNKAGEFFGFYCLSERFAGILGPLLFAIISQMTGQSRNSILFLIAFFIVGIWLLAKVDFERGHRVALAKNS